METGKGLGISSSAPLGIFLTNGLEEISFSATATVPIMITLKAPEFSQKLRAPIDLVLVLDKSGSMIGEKLELVQQTASFIAQTLTKDDRLALVTFDYEAQTILDLRHMDEEGKVRRAGIN